MSRFRNLFRVTVFEKSHGKSAGSVFNGSPVGAKEFIALVVICATGCMTVATASFAAAIKTDEEVMFFPTSAHLADDGYRWMVPAHGWIYEREEDSIWRKLVVEKLIKWLALDNHVINQETFRERARMFLVDNERGKTISIRIANQVFALSRSSANGHITHLISFDAREIADSLPNSWMRFTVVMPQDDDRLFDGHFQLLDPEGLSVISDIDDTIKHSNVRDRQALLANTFLREFQSVPGMAALYRRWAAAGAAFHYVSSSPWQLYPALSAFTGQHGFPRGSFHLKLFRVKDRTFFDLFASAQKTKPAVIGSILQRYPKRRFILVGDSGEQDPEIYGAVAREHPKQIIHTFIRNVSQDEPKGERFRKAFAEVPASRWHVFIDPLDLAAFRLENF